MTKVLSLSLELGTLSQGFRVTYRGGAGDPKVGKLPQVPGESFGEVSAGSWRWLVPASSSASGVPRLPPCPPAPGTPLFSSEDPRAFISTPPSHAWDPPSHYLHFTDGKMEEAWGSWLTQQGGGGWRGSASEHRVSPLGPGPRPVKEAVLPVWTLIQKVSEPESHLQMLSSGPLMVQMERTRPRKSQGLAASYTAPNGLAS